MSNVCWSPPVRLQTSAPGLLPGSRRGVFHRPGRRLANRPGLASRQLLTNPIATANYGPFWRNLRRIATVHALSTHRLSLTSFARDVGAYACPVYAKLERLTIFEVPSPIEATSHTFFLKRTQIYYKDSPQVKRISNIIKIALACVKNLINHMGVIPHTHSPQSTNSSNFHKPPCLGAPSPTHRSKIQNPSEASLSH